MILHFYYCAAHRNPLKKARGFLCFLACFIWVVLVSPAYVWCTAIVVIKTPDGYWVGADSIRGLGDRSELVCKIHQTKLGLIGKTSVLEGFTASGEDYSLEEEIVNAIKIAPSAEQFRLAIRNEYVDDIWEQMAFLLHDPSLRTKQQISNVRNFGPMPEATKEFEFRNLFLIAIEHNDLKFRQLMVEPASRPTLTGNQYFVDVLDWVEISNTLLRDKYDRLHPSLHQLGVWVKYDKDDAWIVQHPESAIREVLALSHEAYPTTVGPPYAIVHVHMSPAGMGSSRKSQIKFEWIAKGKCPSWTYTLHHNDEAKTTN